MKKREIQTKELRRELRDLVALSAIPAAWISYDPNHLAESVVDLLMSALRLDVAGIRLQTCDSGTGIEAWRGQPSSGFPVWLRDSGPPLGLLQAHTASARRMRKDTAIPNTNLRVVAIPVGLQGECGRIVVGCSRTDFPNKLEKLLLSVAANQAVTAFQLQWAKAKLAEAYNELRASQEKELEAAAFIQQGLMAAKLPQPDFAAVTGRNLSCKEIGGDFFTVTPMDEGLAVVIADVSGKGTSAAILASLLQGMIQADLQAGLPLSEIALSTNKFLCARELNLKYATLVIALVQPDGELEYINCGHVSPLVTSGGGGIVRLREHNIPVGLLPNADFMSAGFRLRPGDRLILVTDGITEAENSNGEFFGEQRLEEFAQGEKPLDEIFSAVRLFRAGRPIQDDCTILELAYVCKGALASQSAST